ncbi:Glycosyl transferase, group 1 [Gloeomargarita lithophora Alchichica-D10]|uniref:Glycosyl transferase, group 1 n=1 Tax=Gloeomargarita lithophora Alchichica-D10 TaxID=1188229 RepID=A0A1J0ACS7_9CYAN|nr:glycosyltransferase family 4 protein [Gloeomargarita lithophora]APB33719.1 Glycosyl transferase, group 1 [Gloeomargarita lithophora Alchichica-D10]
MHIAWLGKKSPFCGNVTYSREVTNALRDRGYQVSFLHFAANTQQDSAQEFSLPCLYKSQIYTLPSPGANQTLLRTLRKLRPDVVHASLTLSPMDFSLPEICAELNLPLIATFHPAFAARGLNFASSTQFLTYQLYAPCLSNYDRVIVFSHLQQELLVRLGVPLERLCVIPNGVDTERYCPGWSNLKSELHADCIFIYQGRMALEKNVEALLQAWKRSEMGSQAKLLMVGNGPLAASLMNHYGPEQGVLWLGFVAQERERVRLLQGADVYVLPSLVEGLSLSLLEAMACGLACVATDAGADGEVLERGAGIILSAQGVATQLRTLLPMLAEQAEFRRILGTKARQRVLERYTLNRNLALLETLYAETARPVYSR